MGASDEGEHWWAGGLDLLGSGGHGRGQQQVSGSSRRAASVLRRACAWHAAESVWLSAIVRRGAGWRSVWRRETHRHSHRRTDTDTDRQCGRLRERIWLGRYVWSRRPDTYFLRSNECVIAARLQNMNLSPCKECDDGVFGSKFVTVVVTGNQQNELDYVAYQ
eukprot:1176401-Rhodomonas_salina.5